MRIILHWVLISVAVWLTSKLVMDIFLDPIWVAAVVGACIKLFNMFVRPIIKILTLPLNLLTLGLFSLIVNGALFWYLGTLIDGFSVGTFQAAFIGALMVSIFNWLLTKVFHFD